MLKLAMLGLFTLLLGSVEAAAVPRTMRLDYYHTGDVNHEYFSVDRIVLEPLAWPGNPNRPIDDTNLGKYYFEVIDPGTNQPIYSRGFASIYGEWESTDEARTEMRTFSESLRFPAPAAAVQVVVKKRDAQNAFREVWSTTIDPKNQFIDDSKPPSPGPLITIQNNGDSSHKVDFLIIGDGYTAAEREKFAKDARRLSEILFATSPYKEHRSDFNVWGLCPAAEESGISRPSTGIHKRSPLGAAYDAFGSERYVLTFDNRAFRDYASYAPYDCVEILVNAKTYGGGGIFNLYSTVAADSLWSPYVFVHEFGHHFAGLADEYYTSPVAYVAPTERIEPWEPNVTAMLDPSNLKWKDLVEPATPIPTPWNKEEYEKYSRDIQKRRAEIRASRQPESVMDALFTEEKEHETAMFRAEKYYAKTGAFEGANYQAKGYYRPEIDCIMFTRDDAGFCPVCRRAIERIIDLDTR
ncbi:MAG TPA: M64 family metallopeptidase [Blastocatellia bacterium]|nr:M64 family metallopeptidase [Blastocatellia bacterium]